MCYIKWNRKLSIGNDKIDKGQEILFTSINTLYSNVKKKKNLKILSELFLETIYVSYIHFINEEDLMKQYNYPGLAKQKLEHNRIITQLINYKNQIETGANREIFLCSFDLRTIMFSHVNNFDKYFGNFYNHTIS